MTIIIPSTDLRNRFSEVESLARQTREPIYLTKNGRGSLVLMDTMPSRSIWRMRRIGAISTTRLRRRRATSLRGRLAIRRWRRR